MKPIVSLLYEEVEYSDLRTGEERVRCLLTTLEVERGRTTTYRIGLSSWRIERDELASVEPRDARLRAPMFAMMQEYLAEKASVGTEGAP